MPLVSEERVTSLDPVFGPLGIAAGQAIWNSPILSMREKAVLLISADLCVPELGLPFELHVGMGLSQAGMPVEDIRELLRHVAPDAGFNMTAMAFQQLVAIATRMGHDATSTASRAASGDAVYHESTIAGIRQLDAEFAGNVDRLSRELWHRPGLSRRERCLATLAVDVVGGTLGPSFDAHLALCRDASITADELRTAIRILAEFSIPKAWEALRALDAWLTADRRDARRSEQKMSPAKSAKPVTITSQVAVAKYTREVLDPADESGVAVVETRLEEHFTGGLVGVGIATHLRLEREDGTGALTCFERISGTLDGRNGSFLLRATGSTDSSHVVHGRWEVVEGSATGDLAGLRGYAAFGAMPDPHAKTGWSADTALTYWFER